MAGLINPQCPQCHRSVATLPGAARFCPKCGNDLTALQDVPAHPEELHVGFPALQAVLRGYTKDELPPTLHNVHSLILLGYANALTNLGWRYEHGRGVARNDAEAERCYKKSARLGNVFAQTKLAARNETEPHAPDAITNSLPHHTT